MTNENTTPEKMNLDNYKTAFEVIVDKGQPKSSAKHKELSKDANSAAGTSSDRHINVVLSMFADSKEKKEIAKANANFFKDVQHLRLGKTLLFPTKYYKEITDNLDRKQAEYNALIQDFADNLDRLIAEDIAGKGTSADQSKYPTKEDILAGKCNVKTRFETWSIDFASIFDCETMQQEARQKWESERREEMSEIDSQLIDRILDDTTNVVEKIKAYGKKIDAGERTAFHAKSWQKHLKKAVDVAKICLSGNQDIADACRLLAAMVARTNWENLKDDPTARSATCQAIAGCIAGIAPQTPEIVAPALPAPETTNEPDTAPESVADSLPDFTPEPEEKTEPAELFGVPLF